MQALRYLGPQQLELDELPRPEIGAGEVLVETRASGICATDLKTYQRGHPHIPPGAVLGHEMSGVIVASRAPGWAEGERVVIAPYASCGECVSCRRNQPALCQNLYRDLVEPGGFAEYLRVPPGLVQRGMHRLPENVPFALGALAEPLACCHLGFEALGFAPGDSLLVVGDGPMGLLQVALGRALGAASIALVGMTPERLAWGARRADHVIDASQDVRQACAELTAGRGFDRVMVSVGAATAAEQALHLARRGGSVNLFAGLPKETRLTLDPARIHYDMVTLVGTSGFGAPHFARAVETLACGSLDLEGFITRQASLAQAREAFDDLAHYRGVKTVFVMHG